MTVRGAVRDTAWRALGSSAAHRAAMAVFPDRLVVAAYHAVPDPVRFGAHLDHYAKHFRIVSTDEVAAAIHTGRSLPPRSLLLTFDDGDRSVYENAFPLLAERRLPGAIFVISHLIDTDEPFWWSEVTELVESAGGDSTAEVRQLKQIPNRDRIERIERLRERSGQSGARHPHLRSEEVAEMQAAGITVGNHTATHPLLDQCDDDELRREVMNAHERLLEILGQPPRSFAYPNGNQDDRVPPILRELGYETGFAFDHRRTSRRAVDALAIPRVRVDADAPLHEVRAITSGLHPLVHSARQVVRRL